MIPELLVVTNIPSPYRVHQLEAVNQALLDEGCRLRVAFLSPTERGRSWPVELAAFSAPYRLGRWPVVYPRPDLPLHTDIVACVDVLRSRPAWALLGGSWYEPAVVASMLLNARRTHVLFWCENFDAISSRRPLVDLARTAVMKRADGFVVPGERSAAWCRQFSRQPSIHMPNVVDESLYGDEVEKLRSRSSERRRDLALDPESVVFLWPARLHPIKGLQPFLRIIRDIPETFTILVAGEGSERTALERILSVSCIDVRLLGHQTTDQLLRLYAVADCLLLPSLMEPFGMVTVEALWAGLPLFISTNVGACPEVVDEDQSNGWVVDVHDHDATRSAFASAVTMGRKGLAEMGRRSRALAERRFSTDLAARTFARRLIEMFPPR